MTKAFALCAETKNLRSLSGSAVNVARTFTKFVPVYSSQRLLKNAKALVRNVAGSEVAIILVILSKSKE